MFKANLFIDRLYTCLIYIYIYILHRFLYTSNLFTLNKNIKFYIFKYSISLINQTIAESQR